MNAHQVFRISEERRKIVEYLGKMPQGKYRAVTAIVRSLLLNAPYTYNGNHFDIQAKSLGAGVWELSIKE